MGFLVLREEGKVLSATPDARRRVGTGLEGGERDVIQEGKMKVGFTQTGWTPSFELNWEEFVSKESDGLTDLFRYK